MNKDIEKAYKIAVRTLKKDCASFGIKAGAKQFDDLWARDALFASFGALALSDFAVVKDTLVSLLNGQRDDGLVPYRIGACLSSTKIMGICLKKQHKPRYLDEVGKSEVKDSNSSAIIVANEYVKKSKDLDFAKEYYPKLKKSLEYYGSGLVEEKPYGNWADSVPKKGNVLYTNVLFWKAVVSFNELSKRLQKKVVNAEKIKKEINNVFWNGKYFSDTGTSKVFSSDGNVLAMVFGLTNEKQKKSILEFILKHKMETFTIKQSYPEHGKSSLWHKLIGLGDYHNLEWLWLGCLYGLVRKEMLEKIAKKINEYDMVYEIYEKNGEPVKRFFHKAEEDFAWSAGLFMLLGCWKVREDEVYSTSPFSLIFSSSYGDTFLLYSSALIHSNNPIALL